MNSKSNLTTLPATVIVTGFDNEGCPLTGTVINKGASIDTLISCLMHRKSVEDMISSAEAFSPPTPMSPGKRFATVRELIAHEIGDFFAGEGALGNPDDEDYQPDIAQLIERVTACLPVAFGWGEPVPVEWQAAAALAEHELIDGALRDFTEDATGDNGVRVVQSVMKVMNNEC